MTASSPSNVWAFGSAGYRGLGIHWDGKRWTRRLFAPRSQIWNAAALGPRGGTWVLGSTCVNGCRNWIQRYDGRTWRQMAIPTVRGYKVGLQAMHARSGTDVWVTGGISRPSSGSKTIAAHWNGKRWRVILGPKVPLREGLGFLFTDVVGYGPKNVRMTGTIKSMGEGSHRGGLLAHWNGSRWTHLRVNEKQGLEKLAVDGRGGLWALSGSHRSLLHIAKGKVDRRYTPQVGGKGQAFGLTHIPGTTSLWAVGLSGRLGTIWKYGK
ncbi:hypothetical protein [Thermomonospora umbrina]|uniref:hypothetical protein n=1 Tax=Thermomonospora umbrina TaxID=111806 RepID=UPI0011C132BC|nr:hypothetical protein [Thermomonospora umbrina]